MVGRNRRVRILALALFGIVAFVLYSRSSASYDEYRQYAEQKYEDAVGRAGSGSGTGSGNGVGGGAVIRPPDDSEKEREAAGLTEAVESAAMVRTTSTLVGSTSRRRVEEIAVETTSTLRATSPTASSSPVVEPTAVWGLPAVKDGDYLPVEGGEGRVEVEVPIQQPLPAAIHWSSSSEHFPVATTIQLPTNKPSPIPAIQHVFKETVDKGADLDRLAVIKAAATHAWYGYREKAWGQDEITPVSGNYKNPFNAWGATLVDALDTLWILGMKAEFDEAVGFVETIDFTTTPRADIPLFETTIRYLGGLLAAYDVSGKKHKVLLDKAAELGEVLYGAFDTPNRMPQTYYHWKPTFASQPHRASARVVLAELGSLSMEFTRLAQLTGEPKYYDAIARITDGFYEWQNNTRLPGMWPTYIDASGCGKPAQMSGYTATGNGPSAPAPDGVGMMAADHPVKVDVGEKVLTEAEIAVNEKYQESLRKQAEAKVTRFAQVDGARKDGRIDGKATQDGDTSKAAEKAELRGTSSDALPKAREAGIVDKIQIEDDTVTGKQKRQLDDYAASQPATGNRTRHQGPPPQRLGVQLPQTGSEVCIPKGLDSPSTYGQESYTLAGMSDSTYEYLPKMHLLLGGRIEQYKEMYLASANAAIEKLIYRPMVKEDRDILAAGDLQLSPNSSSETGEMIEVFKPVSSHLVCFAGGMFALGGKIFDRPEDVEIGRKLTDGCVWSYNVTVTGIMPEDFYLSKCDSRKECAWNETKYWEELDPYRDQRTKVYTRVAAPMTNMPTLPGVPVPAMKTIAIAAVQTPKDLDKRQLDSDTTTDNIPEPVVTSSTPPTKTETDNAGALGAVDSVPVKTYDIAGQFHDPNANTVPEPAAAIYTPPPPMSHQEFVEHKIAAERLPPGMTKITSKNYILRPEAIESVFYMYRITGEQYWRDRGWEMFTAVQDHTRTVWGNSAIDDVTKEAPEMKDSEESFWLAETLKYFYLLFDEPDKWSLDDWVLNTEAHFFKRAG